MSIPKKHHYVPQFLLRGFGIMKKKRTNLWVLDKKTANIFQASVGDIAHENHFYQYQDGDKRINLEELLEKVESKCAPILSKICRSGKFKKTTGEIVDLSYYLASQMMRTPHTRKEIENIRNLIIAKVGSDIRVHTDDKLVGEYGPEDDKISSLNILLESVPEFAEILQEKIWCICESPRQGAFIISDNPVSKHNMIERPGRGNLGLNNEGIEIYMPISPRYTIQALCPKLSLAAIKTPELQEKYSQAITLGIPIPQSNDNLDFLNSQQVIWAERFVYAKAKSHLEMPLDMLRTHPELREGPGNRQRVNEI